MTDIKSKNVIEIFSKTQITKHNKCLGRYDEWQGDWDCGYQTTISCDDCKYSNSGGRKDPEAKCNELD